MSKIVKNKYVGATTQGGLSGVRQNPAMYVGSTGVFDSKHSPRALIQMLQEVVSNAADEYIAGYGTEIQVIIGKNNSATIVDNGRGIPKGVGDSFDDVIRIATVLHTSGKREGEGYATMGITGMHGIGLKAANALSKRFIVHAVSHSTRYKRGSTQEKELDGGIEVYHIEFKQEEVIKKKVVQRYSANEIEFETNNIFKVKKTGERKQTGTVVFFLPDNGPVSEKVSTPMLESIDWKLRDITPRLEMIAFLNAGLKVTLKDERLETPYIKEWYFEKGMVDYVDLLSQEYTALGKMKAPIYFEDNYINAKGNQFEVAVSLTFVDDSSTNLYSYANGIQTKEGGPHEDGYKQGLLKAFNDFATDRKLLKKGAKFVISDVLEGLVSVFVIKIPSDKIQFEGQMKEKLGTAEAYEVLSQTVHKNITNWLYDNLDLGEVIVKKILVSKEAREAAQAARKEAREGKTKTSKKDKLMLSSKLRDTRGKDPKKNELFLIEGDSAGNILQDPTFQAVLTLRGKVLNVSKSTISKILANKEIVTLITALNVGLGAACDPEECRFHNIMICTDADSDGGHIKMLLLTLFYRYLRPLLERGYVYIVEVPLFKAIKYVKGTPIVKMYYTQKELDLARKKKEIDDTYQVTRFKGLGEMSDSDRYKTISNISTRKVCQVTLKDAKEAERLVSITMSNEHTESRKEFVFENVEFDTDGGY